MTYNPNDPNDPLRHKFLERKTYDGYVMPIGEKIANALGTTPEQLEQGLSVATYLLPRGQERQATLPGSTV